MELKLTSTMIALICPLLPKSFPQMRSSRTFISIRVGWILLKIGRQAAVVNLSDVAGSGAYPTWALWSLQIPSHWLNRKLSQVCRGFISELAQFNTRLVGGNLCVGGDNLAIHVIVGGTPFNVGPVTRSGAKPGDNIYVSGTLGNSAPALRTVRPKHIKLKNALACSCRGIKSISHPRWTQRDDGYFRWSCHRCATSCRKPAMSPQARCGSHTMRFLSIQ